MLSMSLFPCLPHCRNFPSFAFGPWVLWMVLSDCVVFPSVCVSLSHTLFTCPVSSCFPRHAVMHFPRVLLTFGHFFPGAAPLSFIFFPPFLSLKGKLTFPSLWLSPSSYPQFHVHPPFLHWGAHFPMESIYK